MLQRHFSTRTKDVSCLAGNATYEKMVRRIDAAARQIAIEEDRVQETPQWHSPPAHPSRKTQRTGGDPISPRRRQNTGRFLNLVRGKKPVHNVMEEGTDSTGGYLGINLIRTL